VLEACGKVVIRSLDFTFALFSLLIGSPILLLIFAMCFFATGSPLFIQERLGRRARIFKLLKVRTMSKGIIAMASHLVDSNSITEMGNLLRRSKLDELAQLWNGLKGAVSLVGPSPQHRPSMFVCLAFDVVRFTGWLIEFSNKLMEGDRISSCYAEGAPLKPKKHGGKFCVSR